MVNTWARVKPEVLVTALLNLSQMGLVTYLWCRIKYFMLTGDPYLATSEWVDLISGNGSDMARLNLV